LKRISELSAKAKKEGFINELPSIIEAIKRKKRRYIPRSRY